MTDKTPESTDYEDRIFDPVPPILEEPDEPEQGEADDRA